MPRASQPLPAAILFAALFLAATPAAAEVTTFARAGAWEAFGGTTNNGQKVCGVSTAGDGKYLGVKYYAGDSSLTIQLSSTKWKLRDGAKIAVTMKFDDQSPWRARATGFHMRDGDAALQFEIDENQVGRWIDEFRQSYQLIIGFPDDDVSDWRANLRGTAAIADSMVQCLRAMKRS